MREQQLDSLSWGSESNSPREWIPATTRCSGEGGPRASGPDQHLQCSLGDPEWRTSSPVPASTEMVSNAFVLFWATKCVIISYDTTENKCTSGYETNDWKTYHFPDCIVVQPQKSTTKGWSVSRFTIEFHWLVSQGCADTSLSPYSKSWSIVVLDLLGLLFCFKMSLAGLGLLHLCMDFRMRLKFLKNKC